MMCSTPSTALGLRSTPDTRKSQALPGPPGETAPLPGHPAAGPPPPGLDNRYPYTGPLTVCGACSPFLLRDSSLNAALAGWTAMSSPAVYSASSTPPLNRRHISNRPTSVRRTPLKLSKPRVEHTSCTRPGRPRVRRPPEAWPAPLGVMTTSIHKLSAGSGYDYLTRQVAALDATAKGHVGLASYYTERGRARVCGSALALPAWTA